MKNTICAILLILLGQMTSYAQSEGVPADNRPPKMKQAPPQEIEAPVDTEYVDALKAFFTSVNSDEVFKRSISQMMDLQKGMYPNADQELWDLFEKKLLETSLNDLIVDLVPVYQEHLTIADLKELTAFFNTPTGKKYAEATPDIVQESMKVGGQWGQQLGRDFMNIIEEYENSTGTKLGL